MRKLETKFVRISGQDKKRKESVRSYVRMRVGDEVT